MCRSRIGNNAYVPRYWCGSQIWRGCIKIVHFGAQVEC